MTDPTPMPGRGPQVLKLQQRLQALGYLEDPADGLYGPATMQAVRDFQHVHGLPEDGRAGAETCAQLYADAARPRPVAEAPPIDEAEVQHHLRFVQEIVAADTKEERLDRVFDGFYHFGMRFGLTLNRLAEQAPPEWRDEMAALSEEGTQRFVMWLAGRQMTGRADESERRVRAARMVVQAIGEGSDSLGRIAALALLKLPEGHPERDVEAARAALERYLALSRRNGDAESFLLGAGAVLGYRLEPPEALAGLTEEMETHLAQLEAGGPRPDGFDASREGRVALFSYYVQEAIDARDRGEPAAQQQWADRAEAAVAQFNEAPDGPDDDLARNMLVFALLLEIQERLDEAADTYARSAVLGARLPSLRATAARAEGRVRLYLNDARGAAAALIPCVSYFQDAYLAAVDEEQVESTGESFAQVVTNLAFAHALLGEWGEAVAWLERGKSVRARYQAALRSSPAGRHLLELEGMLHALRRGAAPARAVPEVVQAADWLGAEVSPEARVLKAYRNARSDLSHELRKPSVREIAEALAPDEAAVLMGLSYKGLLLCVVFPGDDAAPGAHLLLEDWPLKRFVGLLGGEEGSGWIFALAAVEPADWHREALDAMLGEVDEAVGRPLQALLADRPVRRLYIVPHLWLHVVPWWAVPSLQAYEVVPFPSAAHLLDAKAPAPPGGGHVLAVANPTGDLPTSPAETAALRHRMGQREVPVHTLSAAEATEEALRAALADVGVFHFCGHGRTEWMHPTRSALLVYPDRARLEEDGRDPLAALAARASAWRQTPDNERYADLPGLGRLYERTSEHEDGEELAERRFEYSEHGTLWGRYRDGHLALLAELWTAGDILVQQPLQRCRLAVLSACESGGVGLSAEVDEYAGLPAALQRAGVSAVVASMWPVSDVLTVLFADLFYEALAVTWPEAQVPALVRGVGRRLRDLGREDAAARLGEVRRRTDDPKARFRLEAYAHRLAGGAAYPFRQPYDWAAFYATGADTLTFEAEVSHADP